MRTMRSSGPQPAVGGSFGLAIVRNVNADHGKIAIFKFPNVGAVVEGNRLPAVCVRVGADSAAKFNWRIHVAQQSAKRGKNARKKYQHIAGVSIKLVSPIFWPCQARRKNANRFCSIGKRLVTPSAPTGKEPLSHKKNWPRLWN